jgi:hypothetical protein
MDIDSQARRLAKRNMALIAFGIVTGIAVTITLGALLTWWISLGVLFAACGFGIGVGIYFIMKEECYRGFVDRAKEKLKESHTHE